MKIKVMQTFTDIFNTILTGDKESSKKASKYVRVFLYKKSDNFKEIQDILEMSDLVYRGIIEEWRQVNFVVAISVLYFLQNKDAKQDFQFPWLFFLIKHKNGIIRHSAVRMFRHQLGPLTVHIRCPYGEFISNKFIVDRNNKILSDMYIELLFLANTFSNPMYAKYKYIDSIPVGPYKSIQLVLATMHEYCGEKYLKQIIINNKNYMTEHKKNKLPSDLPKGAFVSYFYLFPEDIKEQRKIMLLQDTFGLSKGAYILIENYCTDYACDCRKVMINVAKKDTNEIIGTIGFGWESLEYYVDWARDDALAKEMIGAYIEMGGIQTGLQNQCLELVNNSLRDKNYIERIKGRYVKFKDAIK